MRLTRIYIATACALLIAVVVRADSYATPTPKGYSSRELSDPRPAAYAEVFPPQTTFNQSKQHSLCYVYYVQRRGRDFTMTGKLLWVKPLLWRPSSIIITPDGSSLIAIGRGHDNCITIYDSTGNVLKNYSITDLFTQEEISLMPSSTTTRSWILLKASRLYKEGTVLGLSGALPMSKASPFTKPLFFDLKTGTLLQSRPEGKNERTSVYRHPIRFASLTELMSLRGEMTTNAITKAVQQEN